MTVRHKEEEKGKGKKKKGKKRGKEEGDKNYKLSSKLYIPTPPYINI